jgi:hypothetical protein
MGYFRTFLHLIFLLIFWTHTGHGSSGYDLYTNRPDVLQIPEVAKANNKEWNNFNVAQLEFLAQLFGLYPDQVIYFLARDGEYLYDLALLLSQNFPEIRKKVRLINVSRLNLNDPLLQDYLKQEGLTEDKIKKTGVVFVDSGYKGSIPIHIKKFYSEKAQYNMYIHLAFSHEPTIPGSASFVVETNVNGSNYEQMARYFRRSTGFSNINGKIIPISPKAPTANYQDDGIVDKKQSLEYLSHLAHFASQPETIKRFERRLRQWLYLTKIVEGERYSLKRIFLTLDRISREWTHPRSQALISDFINFHYLSFTTTISLKSVRPQLGKEIEFDPAIMLEPILKSSDINNSVQNFSRYDIDDFSFLTIYILNKTKKNPWMHFTPIWTAMSEKHLKLYLGNLKKELTKAKFDYFIHQFRIQIAHLNNKHFESSLKNLDSQKMSHPKSCKTTVGNKL